MSQLIPMKAVGYVRSQRHSATDDHWDEVVARIELDQERFGPDALLGLESFSHVEVLFHFHAAQENAETGARHPRGNAAWPKIGIFAQRAKDRPNHIGATICRVVAVQGTALTVAGLDAIDGTPVLDIKPVLQGFLPRGDFREPEWAAALMTAYW